MFSCGRMDGFLPHRHPCFRCSLPSHGNPIAFGSSSVVLSCPSSFLRTRISLVGSRVASSSPILPPKGGIRFPRRRRIRVHPVPPFSPRTYGYAYGYVHGGGPPPIASSHFDVPCYPEEREGFQTPRGGPWFDRPLVSPSRIVVCSAT